MTATVLRAAGGTSLTNTASVVTSSNDRVAANDRDSTELSVARPQAPAPPASPNPPPATPNPPHHPQPPTVDPCPTCPDGLAVTGVDVGPATALGFACCWPGCC